MEQTDQIIEDLPVAVRAAVDAAVQRVDTMTDADPELVRGDAVETVALRCPLDVALALCEQEGGFVPDTVRARLFEAEHAETFDRARVLRVEREAAEQKTRQRSQRAAATRAQTAAAEAAVASAAVKSATCPHCFQLRAASGVCGCD